MRLRNCIEHLYLTYFISFSLCTLNLTKNIKHEVYSYLFVLKLWFIAYPCNYTSEFDYMWDWNDIHKQLVSFVYMYRVEFCLILSFVAMLLKVQRFIDV